MQRATVNFEMDMGRIPSILNLLASEEGNQLLNVAARLSSLNTANQVRDLKNEIDNVEKITTQLKQYLKMMGELDSILNGTILPQPVAVPAEPVQAGTDSVDDEVFDNIRDLKEKLGEVKDFTKFLESATEEMNGNIGGENDSKEG
jgi:hypothetical protein|tara:strand:+ start:150 stop:587 length:438 start_codon:yes stop_codon:yes gene_type:complete